MSESDAENFSGDMDFIADLIGLFIKKGVLKKMSEGETEDLIAYLVSSGLLQEVGELFGSYQRMKPINDAIGDAAMRLLVKQLGDPDTYLEKYEELLDLIRSMNPDATIISLSAFCGAHHEELGAMIEAYNQKNNCKVHFIDSFGWIPEKPLHPLRDGHTAVAKNLIPLLGKIVG